MHSNLIAGFVGLGLMAVCMFGCGVEDPVAATTRGYTIAPEARQGPEGADRGQAEQERRQAAADRAARRGNL